MTPMMTFIARDVDVSITTTGTTGVPITEVLTFMQEGEQGIEVETDPLDLASLTATRGTISVDVDFLGSTAGWAAELTTNPGDFLELDVLSGVAGDDVLTITYGENTTASLRTGTVTLRATGGTGTAGSVLLTLTQSGGSSHTLTSVPTYTPVLVGGTLTAATGEISIALTLGAGATGWTATEALDYVSLTSPSGSASDPVVVTYRPNPTFVARPVAVSITTTGPTGVPVTDDVSIFQSGAQGITVGTDPADLASLTATRGTISVDVDFLGSTAGWAAEITTDPGDFLEFE